MSSMIETDGSVSFSAEYSAGLQVIVCSLPRTGTTSIKLALEHLGYRKVYHMRTFINHPEDYKYWEYVVKAKEFGHHIPRLVWDDLFDDYQVVVDAPSCYFAIELAEAYPNAKVVILNRDSEKWYYSFLNTVQETIKWRESFEFLEWILRPFLPSQASAVIRIGNILSKSGVGLGSYDKEECLKFFYRYYADCRAQIAPERCIDFKVQDGWYPLCKHLGACVPGHRALSGWITTPFPRANDAESFHSWVTQFHDSMTRQVWRNLFLFGLLLIGITMLFIRVMQFIKLHLHTHES
ncbi:hypothetical protein F5Y03DRAFT_384581 [Xylaria venustula]|nr:hypothetical protein F5Y03DRAFT_384581 [Xylaria venustula]